jgi:hypothetical protein
MITTATCMSRLSLLGLTSTIVECTTPHLPRLLPAAHQQCAQHARQPGERGLPRIVRAAMAPWIAMARTGINRASSCRRLTALLLPPTHPPQCGCFCNVCYKTVNGTEQAFSSSSPGAPAKVQQDPPTAQSVPYPRSLPPALCGRECVPAVGGLRRVRRHPLRPAVLHRQPGEAVRLPTQCQPRRVAKARRRVVVACSPTLAIPHPPTQPHKRRPPFATSPPPAPGLH